jgi:hypothetical protein
MIVVNDIRRRAVLTTKRLTQKDYDTALPAGMTTEAGVEVGALKGEDKREGVIAEVGALKGEGKREGVIAEVGVEQETGLLVEMGEVGEREAGAEIGQVQMAQFQSTETRIFSFLIGIML